MSDVEAERKQGNLDCASVYGLRERKRNFMTAMIETIPPVIKVIGLLIGSLSVFRACPVASSVLRAAFLISELAP